MATGPNIPGHDERGWKLLHDTGAPWLDPRRWRLFFGKTTYLLWHEGMKSYSQTYHRHREEYPTYRQEWRKIGVTICKCEDRRESTDLDLIKRLVAEVIDSEAFVEEPYNPA